MKRRILTKITWPKLNGSVKIPTQVEDSGRSGEVYEFAYMELETEFGDKSLIGKFTIWIFGRDGKGVQDSDAELIKKLLRAADDSVIEVTSSPSNHWYWVSFVLPPNENFCEKALQVAKRIFQQLGMEIGKPLLTFEIRQRTQVEVVGGLITFEEYLRRKIFGG
jgi:hypothetical protein